MEKGAPQINDAIVVVLIVRGIRCMFTWFEAEYRVPITIYVMLKAVKSGLGGAPKYFLL